ncbi:MAG TPA: hypothetical protein VES40_09255 [Ilumatobacteraceae bacterium]|nr:hypothetical protein [Ilumatobacteraceae bacterium]
MGLFSRKPKDETPEPESAESTVDLPAALEAVKVRLAETEQAKADLEARIRLLDDFNTTLNSRISTLDRANSILDTRLGALDHTVVLIGDQLTGLSASNAGLDQRMVAVEDLDQRLRELTNRLNRPAAPQSPSAPPPPPPTRTAVPPPPPPTAERLDDLALQLDALATAVALHTERMSSVDSRVTSVSTELANQLTELSRDIDELNRRTAEQADDESDLSNADNVDTADPTEIEARLTERLDAAIDDVLDTTEKLAAEQARYEIQFRADLAELAERLRRPNAS